MSLPPHIMQNIERLGIPVYGPLKWFSEQESQKTTIKKKHPGRNIIQYYQACLKGVSSHNSVNGFIYGERYSIDSNELKPATTTNTSKCQESV